MKQVDVTILGQGYVLACDEDGQDALMRAVAVVDREMSAIRDAGKLKARERIAVLAALNVAYRLAQSEARVAELEAQLARPVADPRAPEGLPSSGPAALQPGEDPEGHSQTEELHALIHRIDEVLAGDGRLL